MIRRLISRRARENRSASSSGEWNKETVLFLRRISRVLFPFPAFLFPFFLRTLLEDDEPAILFSASIATYRDKRLNTKTSAVNDMKRHLPLAHQKSLDNKLRLIMGYTRDRWAVAPIQIRLIHLNWSKQCLRNSWKKPALAAILILLKWAHWHFFSNVI